MTARLALIARGDRGGLGSQTAELHRHLRPAKTLVMNLGEKGRGPTSLSEFTYNQVRVNVGPSITDANLSWILEDVDVLLTVECDYHPDLWSRARESGVVTILQANPELRRPRYLPDVMIAPTTWELSRLPGAMHLPMPVATDRLPFRQRTEAHTFVHVAAPAMRDRNGTQLVLGGYQDGRWIKGAVHYIEQPIRLVLRGGPLPRRFPPVNSNVELVFDVDSCERYYDCWSDEFDVLVMPRRYGGLSLPVQECAALGIPSIMFGIPPQSTWPGVTTVRASAREQIACIGGEFPLYSCRAETLGRKIDHLVTNPDEVASLSMAAGLYAIDISWDRLLGRYEDLIERAAERRAA